jgi:hypothetical protein
MPFCEHETCLLILSLSNGFISGHSSVKPSSVECGPMNRYSTDTQISTVELCNSFRFIFGLFVASLINALLAWSVSFGGRFVVVPYSFHFLITDLMVLRGMFKVSDIFL